MPFTLAHPAAVLPLVRTRLPFSALVVGSMAPDFPYVLALSTRAQYGHTLAGVFWFCVPASLGVLWVFHRYVKPALAPRLFVPLNAARSFWLSPFRFWPGSVFISIAAAIVIGALSHIAWDSCTHGNGWTVARVPALQGTVARIGSFDLKLYKLLQHGSSLVGMGVLVWYFRRWRRSLSVTSEKMRD